LKQDTISPFSEEGQKCLLQTFGLSPHSNGGWAFNGSFNDKNVSLLNNAEACVRFINSILKHEATTRDDFCLVASGVPVWLVFVAKGTPLCVITSLDVDNCISVINELVKNYGFILTETKGLCYLQKGTKKGDTTQEPAIMKARSLLNKFCSDNLEDIFVAAKQMNEHFEDKWRHPPIDDIGNALFDIMRPKREKALPEGWADFTGGRDQTYEWIAFMLIVDTKNSDYYEYISWLRSAFRRGVDVSHAVRILKVLCEKKLIHQGFVEDSEKLISYINSNV